MYRLLEQADVFLSNLREFELERFGLRYQDLCRINPRIIWGNITGYGKKGPDKNLPAYDTTAYWARSGIPQALSVPGIPVFGYRPAFGDNVAALALAYGVMMALFVRERTGTGQEVDVSLLHTGLYQLSFDIAGALATGLAFEDWRPSPPPEVVTQAQMAILQVAAFYAGFARSPLSAAYMTRDSRRIFFLSLQPDRYWKKFCLAIGREDLANDARYQTTDGRAEHNIFLRQSIGETFLTKTYDEWIPLLEGIPYAPMQTVKEVINDPQARASGCFVSYDHPAYGRIENLANPVFLSRMPSEIRMPAPEFGQHTEEILLEAGYTWEDIGRFKEQKVIA